MLKGKKILVILPQKNFWETDFIPVYDYLEKNEAQLFFASPDNEPAIGYNRKEIKPDLTISEINIMDYDGFIIIGGPGARVYFWNDDGVISKFSEIIDSNKPILALTMSPVALVKTGKLSGKKATVFPEVMALEYFKDFNTIYEKKELLETDHIITTSKTEATERAVELFAGKCAN